MFDFDGLIIDTEEPIYQSWLEVYQAHGEDLPFDRWIKTVGSSNATFDPRTYLEHRLGHPLAQEVIDRRIQRRSDLVLAQAVRPGVAELTAAARKEGLGLGIASSSTRQWVEGHLRRVALRDRFSCLRCRDDVAAVKPAPDLYIASLECLGVAPDEAVAIEDAPNGVTAAKAAGMWCVAVPNAITDGLDLSAADLIVKSLSGLTPEGLAEKLGLTL